MVSKAFSCLNHDYILSMYISSNLVYCCKYGLGRGDMRCMETCQDISVNEDINWFVENHWSLEQYDKD